MISVVRGSARHRALVLGVGAALAAVALLLPYTLSSYDVGRFTLVLVYAVAVLGLNLLVGWSGRSRSATAPSSPSGPTRRRCCSTRSASPTS